jgi:hypothetical protein
LELQFGGLLNNKGNIKSQLTLEAGRVSFLSFDGELQEEAHSLAVEEAAAATAAFPGEREERVPQIARALWGLFLWGFMRRRGRCGSRWESWVKYSDKQRLDKLASRFERRSSGVVDRGERPGAWGIPPIPQETRKERDAKGGS